MANLVKKFDQVDYNALDDAKESFIRSSRRTLGFAKKYGFIPSGRLGASSNVFSLDLKKYFKKGSSSLYLTLLPEGLGTADDARPDDLTEFELKKFWYNIAFKTLGAITNDAAASGAQPILVSLYLPSSSPELVFNENFRKGFLNGFIAACKKVGCVYFSGETPQLRSKIFKDKVDIAGSAVGVLPPGVDPIDGSKVNSGDKIVFIESSGPHENGFSPIRKLAKKLSNGYRTKMQDGREYWQAANAPTVLYSPVIQDILNYGLRPTNIEPITGHGWQKLMRSAKPFRYVIEQTLPVPEFFKFYQEKSKSTTDEMLQIFNYGAGLAIFIRSEDSANKVVKIAKKHKLKSVIAGFIEKSNRREVLVKPFNVRLQGEEFTLKK